MGNSKPCTRTTVGDGATRFGLVQVTAPPIRTGDEIKIRWRVTGEGPARESRVGTRRPCRQCRGVPPAGRELHERCGRQWPQELETRPDNIWGRDTRRRHTRLFGEHPRSRASASSVPILRTRVLGHLRISCWLGQACHAPVAPNHRCPAAEPSSAGPRNAVTNATAVGKVVMPSHAPTGRATREYWLSQRAGGANTG